MSFNPYQYLLKKFADWMGKQSPAGDPPICDFDRICYELRPCDVILVEGRSRASKAIRLLTHSPWTHVALYVGKLYEIRNRKLREHIANHYHEDPEEPLVIEGLIGKGTLVSPLSKYRTHHIRICRPNGISPEDSQRVIAYCAGGVGYDYNIRQVFDLMRYTLPITFLPRRLFSSLFNPNGNKYQRKICSSLLAEAFHSVEFPVLPKIIINKKSEIELVQRNPNLFSPGDFDYSPYFDIIKYPLFGMTSNSLYHNLPWKDGVVSNDEIGLFHQIKEKKIKLEKAKRKD